MMNVELTQKDNQKVVYQAVIVFRDGKKMRISGGSSENEVRQAVRDNMRRLNQRVVDVGGGIGMEFEDTGKEESYDVMSYEIRSRYVTPWEVIDEIEVK